MHEIKGLYYTMSKIQLFVFLILLCLAVFIFTSGIIRDSIDKQEYKISYCSGDVSKLTNK
jgi:uncharacterized membrane protein YcjF (UPF0283 family)